MDLTAEVSTVKGIGERTARVLAKAGIFTVGDLLYFLPRDYENYQTAIPIKDLKPGKVVVRGKVESAKVMYTRRRGLTITEAIIRDDTGAMRAVWFNQPYRAKQFDSKREYFFIGNYEMKGNRFQLMTPSATLVEDIDPSAAMQPIYKATGGIKSLQFRKYFDKLRPEFNKIPDILPGAVENAPNTPDFVFPHARADALFKMHFPEKPEDVTEAREYLAYEELFELLLAANLSKQENRKLKAEKIEFNDKIVRELTEKLPFKLTDAQRRATFDILKDMEKSTPMNRLLQGDVGSGKTIVAAIAAYEAIKQGFQVALLAPTAILATQHAESLYDLLTPLGIRIALVTGATKNKVFLKKLIASGDVDLVIGTHAIITDDTLFHSLALCIIDEQHRFGVNQRQKLLLKTAHNTKYAEDKTRQNYAPHLLSMTATPIPRSLQLTVFGDLDVSVINELPKGRQPIATKILQGIQQKDVLYPKITEEIDKGRQVYWICPAIEDNPRTETTSVKKQTKHLQEIFKGYRVEFLHGRMETAEKDHIMSQFAKGKIDILVSTTVVEVGVNVPNATVMVIANAESYGLAQLHQLRGRVGRGSEESFCFLITDDEDPTKRLKELERSTDGFHLAEVDLKLRGPGEIYGSLQHGSLNLSIAKLTDTILISAASKQAKAVAAEFAQNPDSVLKYKELSQSISHYQQLTTLN